MGGGEWRDIITQCFGARVAMAMVDVRCEAACCVTLRTHRHDVLGSSVTAEQPAAERAVAAVSASGPWAGCSWVGTCAPQVTRLFVRT